MYFISYHNLLPNFFAIFQKYANPSHFPKFFEGFSETTSQLEGRLNLEPPNFTSQGSTLGGGALVIRDDT